MANLYHSYVRQEAKLSVWTKTSTEPRSCQADHLAFSSSGSNRDPTGAPKKCSSARLQVSSSCCASEAGRDLMLRTPFLHDVPMKTGMFRGFPIYIMGWMVQLGFHLSMLLVVNPMFFGRQGLKVSLVSP